MGWWPVKIIAFLNVIEQVSDLFLTAKLIPVTLSSSDGLQLAVSQEVWPCQLFRMAASAQNLV